MEDCIFCKIIKRELPAAVVYEDDYTVAFMTIEAINEGHTLVVPKQHVAYLFETDDDQYTRIMQTVRKVSKAVNRALKPGRVGIMVTGWEVAHTHVHIVPLHDQRDITSKKIIDNNVLKPDQTELAKTANLLKGNI